MYILKRLTDAKRDGNQIYAILSGYGTSQEGLTRSTGTPTIDGEARAITLALKDAGVSPFDIDWLEMHGTGTKVGDPIEVAATRLAYELNIEESEREKPLIITSVKANIGHTESVSGAAGLLKVMLAIKHGAIPPQRLTSAINPKLNLKGFHIPLELTPWKGKYAGVSSFGITGTNSHLIVERFSMPKHTGSSESNGIRSFILPLSAKCPSSMTALRKRHAYALQNLDGMKPFSTLIILHLKCDKKNCHILLCRQSASGLLLHICNLSRPLQGIPARSGWAEPKRPNSSYFIGRFRRRTNDAEDTY